METPVYLFTGFLEAGKTKFIQEALAAQPFTNEGNTLLIICEEGVEEYDPTAFSAPNVRCEIIDSAEELTEEKLAALQEKHDAFVVIVEYNGMWLTQKFYDAMPVSWYVYEEVFICDSITADSYNKNMRSLFVDKLTSCDMAVFNRVSEGTDIMALHKLVRGVSRNAGIVYDRLDGTVEHDTIEDPLPFDINADIIKIEDRDFAYWYRDLAAEMDKYDGKKVRFKGMIVKDADIPKGSFICGRHVMVCCADDIRYSGIACKWRESEKLKTYDWAEITGKISIENHKVYESAGPVIRISSVIPASPPEEQVASFN